MLRRVFAGSWQGYWEGFLSGIGAPQPSVSSRKADCQFRVTTSWAQLRNSAPIKTASARLAPSSIALNKFAPSRCALDKFAPLKFLPRRSAPRRSASERSNPLKSRPRRPARDKSGVSLWCAASGSSSRPPELRATTKKSNTYPLRRPLPRLGPGTAHASLFSLAACSICGSIFSIA